MQGSFLAPSSLRLCLCALPREKGDNRGRQEEKEKEKEKEMEETEKKNRAHLEGGEEVLLVLHHSVRERAHSPALKAPGGACDPVDPVLPGHLPHTWLHYRPLKTGQALRPDRPCRQCAVCRCVASQPLAVHPAHRSLMLLLLRIGGSGSLYPEPLGV